MNRLAGKVALISGGASGIGAATARAIVAQGGKVAIGDLSVDKGEALVAEIGGSAIFTHLDVAEEGSWDEAVRATEAAFGRLNVLVNGAGVLTARTKLSETSRSDWDLNLAVNLTGTYLGIVAALPYLKRDKPSSIINISSFAGLRGVSPQHGYTAAKFAVRGLSKSAALELSNEGVRVNSVHPGTIDTPMIAPDLEPRAEQLKGETDSLKRAADPAEIASLIVFLASDESSYSTGAEFIADGGMSAGTVI